MEMTAAGLVSAGYEGRDLEHFVDELVDSGVNVLVDVRLTPISRKRGFSKSALAAVLATVGIRYQHVRELGNPKPNRAGFAGDLADLRDARSRYAELLDQPAASRALDDLAHMAGRDRIAVMCFEADEHRCHRHVVLTELHRRLVQEPVPGCPVTRRPSERPSPITRARDQRRHSQLSPRGG